MKNCSNYAITHEQAILLRKIARKNWAFFRTFVREEDNWLPVDNVQEYPAPQIAHRTSPTNVGFGLLATLAAYDFGYLTSRRLIERVTNTFNTMDLLERHQGHFFNWYDTKSLKPLRPIYVSTVDSGNLAASLLTLGEALLVLPDKSIVDLELFSGLLDTLTVLIESIDAAADQKAGGAQSDRALLIAQFRLDLQSARQSPLDLADVRSYLVRLTKCAEEIIGTVNNTVISDIHWWAQVLFEECSDALANFDFRLPWMSLLETPGRIGKLESHETMLTMRHLANLGSTSIAQLSKRLLEATRGEVSSESFKALEAQVAIGSERAKSDISHLGMLACRAREFAQMEYEFLFDERREMLSIGYNLSDSRLDFARYDLLASEARLCYFTAIAQGQIPRACWFALGRKLATFDGQDVLLSWNGSMLEYLMPLLVMPSFDHSLLSQTYQEAVNRQIEYGNDRGVPWGMSASLYNAMDDNLTYQYKAFGVPGLGLKAGLDEDLVIAPHATALALMVAPEAAVHNLQKLASLGFVGKYGFYEAIDYTPARVPPGQTCVIVKSFMAHHQGMTLLSLSKVLLKRPMQELFESEQDFRALMTLLKEPISVVDEKQSLIDRTNTSVENVYHKGHALLQEKQT